MVKCAAPDSNHRRWIRKNSTRIDVDQSRMIKNICDYQKEDCISNVKRPQLRYLLANTSLHQPVETFFTSGALLFDQVV